MLSARKTQMACPRCRIQLLRLFENGLSGVASQRRIQSYAAKGGRTVPRATSRQLRQFSSSWPVFQEAPASDTHSSKEEIEMLVRQAKETFGDTLPPNYLTPEEYKVYERLYGAPLRETLPEDVGIPLRGDLNDAPYTPLQENGDVILREAQHDAEPAPAADHTEEMSVDGEVTNLNPQTNAQTEYINAAAKNSREHRALMKLQRDFEASSVRPAEEPEEDIDEEPEEEEDVEEEDEYDEDPDVKFANLDPGRRLHELTVQGQFRTNPRTVWLPTHDVVDPIKELLRRTDSKHVQEAAERLFGGRGLPYSASTPTYKGNYPQQGIAMQAGQPKMSEIEADAYISTVFPAVYASVRSILVEVRKRLGSEWLRGLVSREKIGGPRVLDAGGAGAGLAAWNEVFGAEWTALVEKGAVSELNPPTQRRGERAAVVGSDYLRHRVSELLRNTSFLPRLPDYVHSNESVEHLLDGAGTPKPRKQYDIVIAPHLLMPIAKDYKRKQLLDNLWAMLNPDGGVLIFLEKGHPRGFEAVADVRQRILDEYIISPLQQSASEFIETETQRIREPGMILAPCTNHTKCPMYLQPGLTHGRKDFCHFNQRFIRPSFLKKIHGSTDRDHEDIQFSYVAVQRQGQSVSLAEGPTALTQGKQAADRAFQGYENGDEGPHVLSLPRNILPPLKRHGHVTMDLCTPAGEIERWTVPKSFSKQAYHDARKAKWGDLWALGAKTRALRPIRLGKGGTAAVGGKKDKKGRKGEKDQKRRTRIIELSQGSDGNFRASEQGMRSEQIPERRTKGGKKRKMKGLLEEMDEEEIELDDEVKV